MRKKDTESNKRRAAVVGVQIHDVSHIRALHCSQLTSTPARVLTPRERKKKKGTKQ